MIVDGPVKSITVSRGVWDRIKRSLVTTQTGTKLGAHYMIPLHLTGITAIRSCGLPENTALVRTVNGTPYIVPVNKLYEVTWEGNLEL